MVGTQLKIIERKLHEQNQTVRKDLRNERTH